MKDKQPQSFVVGWGENQRGQCGQLNQGLVALPSPFHRSASCSYAAVAASETHTLVMSTEGKVYSIGGTSCYPRLIDTVWARGVAAGNGFSLLQEVTFDDALLRYPDLTGTTCWGWTILKRFHCV
jgi:hypothetical protein